MYVPSVIKLRVYRYLRIRIRLVSRRNILLRDGYRCQYCGDAFEARDLTLDHVIPRVQGGQRTWENLVAACAPCNRRKGGRTPWEAEMRLLHRPIPASVHTSRHVLRSAGMVVPGWQKYLFGDHDGDPRYVYREAA
jgi:5-methylcytosine-specific restriction endonuclease McrA